MSAGFIFVELMVSFMRVGVMDQKPDMRQRLREGNGGSESREYFSYI